LLSLEKVNFIDSSAIGWLIDNKRKTEAAGGKIVLYSATPRVRDLFNLLKLKTVLNLKDDEKSAAEFVTSQGGAQ
jgi:anti-anti-sigma factor